MSFAELENVWRSPHNRPSPDQLAREKMRFVTELKRRHRGFVIFSALTFTALLVIAARLLWHVLDPESAGDPIDPAREWASLLLLALPWIAWVLMVRRHRRHVRGHADYDGSISASVRALLDQNRLARARLKLVAVLHGALLVLLPFVVYQLRAAGKAGDEIIVPAFVIWPVIAIGIGLAMFLHDRRTLQPRQRELEALLETYSHP